MFGVRWSPAPFPSIIIIFLDSYKQYGISPLLVHTSLEGLLQTYSL